jgi:hypothetical protein
VNEIIERNRRYVMNVEDFCFLKAQHMISNGLAKDMDLFDLTDLLISIEKEKEEKQLKNDVANIDFNDEIISIEEVGELETVDISVTGDQLFYCNGILTKNSMGITHTADAIFALITSEELESMNQLMIKQLKNRWGDLSYFRRFVIGIDKSKMKLYNLEDSAQDNIFSEPKMDKKVSNNDSFDGDIMSDKLSKRGNKKLFDADFV